MSLEQGIRLLDPIGLISWNQSSRHFRRLINLQKKHLVERLLQLEISSNHGGPTLIFRSRDSKFDPDWQDAAWESMRWACTECLRLLPHKCFDNHSLLRLGFWKPLPDSDAARMITTWESSPVWRPQHRLMRGSEAYRLEKSRRVLYLSAVTKCVMCDVQGNPAEHLDVLNVLGLVGFERLFEKEFRDMDDDEQLELFDEMALSIENEECGKKRYLRNCNECRFRKSLFSYTRSSFPRILEYIEKQETVRPKYQRHWTSVSDVHGTVPPDARAGKRFGLFAKKGSIMDGGTVSTGKLSRWAKIGTGCAATGELAEYLKKWIVGLLDEKLGFFSSLLCQLFNSQHFTPVGHLPEAEAREWRALLEQTPWFNAGNNSNFSREALDLINTRRRQWKELLDRAKESNAENSLPQILDDLYNKWIRHSDTVESRWKWLMGCKEEIEGYPELLVNWALDRDGAAFT
ncbi:uncharacterized protein FPOAC1_013470 [Fusarium poae]|uniref:uncharacterized protein n=1 Tax=Fusarium poae TaxID=36050 RepID=UPI001D044AFA|nr:uncharacterized protein FPOAC1_013470 [Fusarium poae]KAG8664690.1 hypothetical protein FPOAC1_013470 [Fusarium poae]